MELHDFLDRLDEMPKPLMKSKNFRMTSSGDGWVKLMALNSGRSIDIEEKHFDELIKLLKKAK